MVVWIVTYTLNDYDGDTNQYVGVAQRVLARVATWRSKRSRNTWGAVGQTAWSSLRRPSTRVTFN